MERISHMDMTKPAIEMREIVKKFGDFTANDHINLLVHKGEVHAILGENGAGKSTLMNVLYGLYQPTSGQIFVGGKEEVIHSPSRAIELGIGMVHLAFYACTTIFCHRKHYPWNGADERSYGRSKDSAQEGRGDFKALQYAGRSGCQD